MSLATKYSRGGACLPMRQGGGGGVGGEGVNGYHNWLGGEGTCASACNIAHTETTHRQSNAIRICW